MVGKNRLPGRCHAPHIAVGHCLVNMIQKCPADTLGQRKSKITGITRIQFQYRCSGSLHPQSLHIQRSPNIRVDMGQAIR